MNAIKIPELPQAHIDFANAIAAEAKKHGIKQFSLMFEPDWDDPLRRSYKNFRIHGGIKIEFSAKDGRGRPCDNLRIIVSSEATTHLIQTPESCS